MSTFKEGVQAERTRSVSVIRRFSAEINQELGRRDGSRRSSARMRAIAAMFDGLADLVESGDDSVEQVILELREGFAFVSEEDARSTAPSRKALSPKTVNASFKKVR